MTTPFSETICRRRLGLVMISMHTKFEVSSLSRYRDTLGRLKI